MLDLNDFGIEGAIHVSTIRQLNIYTAYLESEYQEMKKIRHDYYNILLSIAGYIEEKDMQGLESYFKQEIFPICSRLQEGKPKLGMLSYLKVPAVKGLISSKVLEAQGLGIKTIVTISDTIEAFPINKVVLCRILGILLDNGIEESRASEPSALEISMIQKENAQLLIIANTCRVDQLPTLRQMEEAHFSTKGEGRGLGLTIVKELIGTLKQVRLETKIKDNWFIQSLAISHR